MRKARSGDMLGEVQGDISAANVVKTEFARVTGDIGRVKMLSQKTALEIKDLTEWRNIEDVRAALHGAVKAEQGEIKVISLRRSYGGVQNTQSLSQHKGANSWLKMAT